ncbi:hypothetical protein HI914_02783 [Erysiphe necator]|nr:hypothetical protein HI914_02783 [Erysiphe necator]
MQLRILSDIFDITTQKSISIHSKANQLLSLNAQLAKLDNDLRLHDKVLVMFLLKSLAEEFDATRDMILVSARKNELTLDEIVSILASKETELNDPVSDRNKTSDVINFAGKGKARNNSRKKLGPNNRPLYCGYHRAEIGHVQNDCQDYLKTEPGKRWLKSDAGVAWIKGAAKRTKSNQGKNRSNMEGYKANAAEDSSDEVLNMAKNVDSLHSIYESDDSMYFTVPCDTAYAVPQVTNTPDWYLDSCASKHITPNRHFFIKESLKPHKISIKCADNKFLVSEEIGDIKITWEDDNRTTRKVIIRDVLYMPQAGDNLISLGVLRSKVP